MGLHFILPQTSAYPTAPVNSRIRPYSEDHELCCDAEKQKGHQYDRIIVCLGQELNQAGEPIQIVADIEMSPIVRDGMAVGMAGDKEQIRVLGAAAALFPRMGEHLAFIETGKYRAELPASAVAPGFILAGRNIAVANGFSTESRPNTNVNTVTMTELTTLLDGKAELAAQIIELRKWPENGFISIEDLLKSRPCNLPAARMNAHFPA